MDVVYVYARRLALTVLGTGGLGVRCAFAFIIFTYVGKKYIFLIYL